MASWVHNQAWEVIVLVVNWIGLFEEEDVGSRRGAVQADAALRREEFWSIIRSIDEKRSRGVIEKKGKQKGLENNFNTKEIQFFVLNVLYTILYCVLCIGQMQQEKPMKKIDKGKDTKENTKGKKKNKKVFLVVKLNCLSEGSRIDFQWYLSKLYTLFTQYCTHLFCFQIQQHRDAMLWVD